MANPFGVQQCDHRGFLVPVMFVKHDIILNAPGTEPRRVSVDIALQIKCVSCKFDIYCPPPKQLSAEELEKYPL